MGEGKRLRFRIGYYNVYENFRKVDMAIEVHWNMAYDDGDLEVSYGMGQKEELCRGFARKNVSELQKLTAKLDDKYLLELAEEKMQDALKLSKEQYSDLYMRAV